MVGVRFWEPLAIIKDLYGPFQQGDVENVQNYMFGERRWLRSDFEELFAQDSSAI